MHRVIIETRPVTTTVDRAADASTCSTPNLRSTEDGRIPHPCDERPKEEPHVWHSLREVVPGCPDGRVYPHVTMSIRRMSLGAGYRYLMSSVARLDQAGPASGLTAYYAAKGTPPGQYLGAGLAGLNNGAGVPAGSVVSEEALWRMLGMLADPVTGKPLGRAPQGLRTAFIDASGRVRTAPTAVAGFDLTFSAPKSVSVAWALADGATRTRIHAAHRRALDAVITYAEGRVFATRTGRAGAISQDVRGVVAVGFDHWDSRAGDPQLHTHVVVLNRVQAVTDGQWRTLDSKALFRATVGLSELYNGLLADELTKDLGWAWTPEARHRSPEPKWEVDGVPADLREEFSQRSSVIETAKNRLVEDFAVTRGRQPSLREVLQLRQQATLETRTTKQVHSLDELVKTWRKRAIPFVGIVSEHWAAALEHRNDQLLLRAVDLHDGMLRDAASLVVAEVAEKRSTFTRANLFAESLRQLHGVRFASPTDRIAIAERVATDATERAVMLTPPVGESLPASLLRADGTSRLRARDSEIYSTVDLLQAEGRLLEAGQALDGPTAVATGANAPIATVASGGPRMLTAPQGAAVTAVVTSERRLDVLVGAAGTGKSTAMAGVRAAWEATHGPGSVIGLAPSAAAAEVLADAVGMPAENTAKWLTEQKRQPGREARLVKYRGQLARAHPSSRTAQLRARADAMLAECERWAVHPGQLVIIDEASMVATHDLDRITTIAGGAGAKVLLVGDGAQLSPVQAGGAFQLLVDDRDDPPCLQDVRRFRHEWERDASLRMRAGHPVIADAYVAHGRVSSGGREDVLDVLFDSWVTDVRAGRESLMLAADGQTVNDLNERARVYRVTEGEVSAHGIRTVDGITIGVGDVIVTRQNQRALTTGSGGWVKNGDDWIVHAVLNDGSLRVRGREHGGTALLPKAYVEGQVELGYATTAHRAQGRTVDTAHAYVTASTVREPLYVMATRGRESNRLYVDTASNPDTATSHDQVMHIEALDVLRNVIATSGADISATRVRRNEAAAAGRLRENLDVFIRANGLPGIDKRNAIFEGEDESLAVTGKRSSGTREVESGRSSHPVGSRSAPDRTRGMSR